MAKVNFDSLFGALDKADASATGSGTPKLGPKSPDDPPIDVVFKITDVNIKPSDQYNATYLICEFVVVHTEDERAKMGGSYSWTHNVENKFFGLSGTKNFLAAAMGFDPSSEDASGIGKEHIIEAVGDDQPLAGRFVAGRFARKSFKNGNSGITAEFFPVDQEDFEG